jgi:hypothetical protein
MEADSVFQILESFLVGCPLGVTPLNLRTKGEVAIVVFLNNGREPVGFHGHILSSLDTYLSLILHLRAARPGQPLPVARGKEEACASFFVATQVVQAEGYYIIL